MSAMTREQSKTVKEVLKRREMWERIYPASYVERFFSLRDGELCLLLAVVREAIREMNWEHENA